MIIAKGHGELLNLPPKPEDFSEAALKSRPDFVRFTYWSTYHSMQQLPHLCYTWRDLELAVETTRKPIGDLGAGFSTLGLEGALRDIPITPIDITLVAKRDQYVGAILAAFKGIYPLYLDQEQFRAGYEPQRFIPPRSLTSEALLESAKKVLQSALVSDLAAINAPDRAFSITLAHQSVPMHSASREEFLHQQLPEILRVTDLEARIHPLALFKTVAGSLQEVHRLTHDTAALREVARRAGFSFELATPFEFSDTTPSLCDLRAPLLGIFTRRT